MFVEAGSSWIWAEILTATIFSCAFHFLMMLQASSVLPRSLPEPEMSSTLENGTPPLFFESFGWGMNEVVIMLTNCS